MSTRKTVFAIITLIIVASLIGSPVVAQSAVGSLIVTGLDASQFPQIAITARFLNRANKPVNMVDAQEIRLEEDGQEVDFDIQKTSIGVNTILVIDINAAALGKPQRDATHYDFMKVIARRYVETMKEGDHTAIMVTRPKPEGHELFQDFSADKDVLALRLDEVKTGDPVSFYSNPLDGVEDGLQLFKQWENAQAVMMVVLISTGIVDPIQAALEDRVESIAKDARDNNIPNYSILVNNEDNPRHLDRLAEKSAGLYTQYNGAASLDGIFAEIDANRLQYLITYRSSSGSASERRLALSLEGNNNPLATRTFTIDPPPLAPAFDQMLVNQGDPVIREAPAWDGELSLTEVQVSASVAWPDGYERDLIRAELWVDGQIHGEPLGNPSRELIFPWDIRTYVEKGRRTARLEIRIEDELGFTASSMRQEPVDVLIPEKPEQPIEQLVIMPVCDNLAKIPEAGQWLGEYCRMLGITPTQVINLALILLTLVLLILLWINRSKVATAGRGVAGRATDFYQRITQRSGGQQPKARLEAIRGLSAGERAVFEIFGETPVGRDREHAELVFVNHPHISREHCIIHEDKAAGLWTIEDRESANGTFLNGMRIQPFQKYPLMDGDTIEMAQIERGGIKFKFKILQQARPHHIEVQSQAHTEALVEPGALRVRDDESGPADAEQGQEQDVFQTQHIPRNNLMDGSDGETPADDDFDPSQQTF